MDPNAHVPFDKSSKAKEAQGAVEQVSWEEQFAYVNFVGDRDCSSHRDVVKAKPCGDDMIVRKVECVGHIKKRMRRRLRRKKNDMKGKKLSDGKTIRGRNSLIDYLIDSF